MENMKEVGEQQLESMKLVFNYDNVFVSCFYDDIAACIHRSREYAMNYVYSGEMVLGDGKGEIHVGKGECVFIPRDHHITMYKRALGGERYCGIFTVWRITRDFHLDMIKIILVFNSAVYFYAKFSNCFQISFIWSAGTDSRYNRMLRGECGSANHFKAVRFHFCFQLQKSILIFPAAICNNKSGGSVFPGSLSENYLVFWTGF